MDNEQNLPGILNDKEIEKLYNSEMAKRKKALWRRQVPESRSLEDALNTMTKAELDDLRFNLCVLGVSSLKKQELAKVLVDEIIKFSKVWLTTIGIEQYNIITHLSRKNGLSTVLDIEDVRIDYMRSLGITFSGMSDGQAAWYLPNEILDIYRSISNETYRQEITLNDEITHLATGLLFYYGRLSYDMLYQMVSEQVAGFNLSMTDFMGIVINSSCWNQNIVNIDYGLIYYSVLDVNALEEMQLKNADLDYKKYSYDELYAAGEKEFLIINEESKILASVLRNELNMSEDEAMEIIAEIQTFLQNNEDINNIFGFLQHYFIIPNREIADKLFECVEAMRDVIPVWCYKGHSPREISGGVKQEVQIQTTRNNIVKFVPRSSKIGRNDPCPCGSGKKYKKCCMDKV